MRVVAATGIAVALAALTGGAEAREMSVYRGKCGEVVLPSRPARVESVVRIDTTCGTFAIGAQGVRFVGQPRKGVGYIGLVGGRGGWLNFYERGRVRWRRIADTNGARGSRTAARLRSLLRADGCTYRSGAT